MTLGQHKQDMLAGAPRPLASAALARLRIGMEVQVMTFPVEPYRGSGGYCLRVGPPPPMTGCEGGGAGGDDAWKLEAAYLSGYITVSV